jgi:hypothetical protein
MTTRQRSSRRSAAAASTPRRGQYRGEAARAKAAEQQQENEKRREARKQQAGQPYRLYLKPKETREVIIVDDAPDFFMFEHQIWNQGRPNEPKYTYAGCVKEYETCPACTKHGDSHYNLYLTVIDLAEFKDGKGETHTFSKKLMVVKSGSQRKFIRRHAKNGSLRGQVVVLTRDGDKDPVIGNDVEWDEVISEADLTEAYIRSYKDREGKTHQENCGETYEYEKLFPEPTIENIASILTGENAIDMPEGSRAQAAEALDEVAEDDQEVDGWDKDDGPDEEEFDGAEDEDENEEEEEEVQAPPPAARSASSRRRSGRRRL